MRGPPSFAKTVTHVRPGFHLSEPGDRAVAARVERAFERAVGMPDKRAGVAHGFLEISQYFNVMAARSQVVDQLRAQPGLELQRFGGRAPSAPEQPARSAY